MARVIKDTSKWLGSRSRRAVNFTRYMPLGLVVFLILFEVLLLLNKSDWRICLIIFGIFCTVVLIYIKIVVELWDRKLRSFKVGDEGERRTLEELATKLTSDYLLMRDPMPSKHGNVDFAVVGPGGVFAIEAKNWNGRIEVRGDAVYQNGKLPKKGNPIKQTNKEALTLNHELKKCGNGYFVEPILVFCGSGGCKTTKVGRAVVLNLDKLVNYIRLRPQRFDLRTIERISDCIIAAGGERVPLAPNFLG